MTIADRIKERMRALGWIREEQGETRENWQRLADRAEVSYSTIHNLLSGETKEPKSETLQKVAKALKVPADWLLAGGELGDRYEEGYRNGLEAAQERVDRLREELSQLMPAHRAPPPD